MSALRKINLTYHTFRYLRPIQLLSRAWRNVHLAAPDLRLAPALRAASGNWQTCVLRAPSLEKPRQFIFLNESRELASSGDWNNPLWEKLWLYHLHYFDDLTARDAKERKTWHRELIGYWIEENPPGRGVGWEPYPLSLRLVNWIKWALSGNRLEPEWIHSLAVHTRFLLQRLEHHLLGNHLFENAKALLFSGAFFDGPEAASWLSTGARLLRRQIEEQVLTDGGHVERSPMYHALVLEGILDLVQLGHVFPEALTIDFRDRLRETASQMLGWLHSMTHPDGEIALLNDAAFGIARPVSELDAYAHALEVKSSMSEVPAIHHLGQTGYIRLARGPLVAFLDVGKVGPDYNPGHGHADTLSFELSLWGRRVIVDTGTSTYAANEERLYQRSTAAHNTVEIEKTSSSEVWSSFRVARRAYPLDLRIDDSCQTLVVGCGHDGYRRLPGRPIHHREWCATERSLVVADSIHGRFQEAVVRFHFHPDVRVQGDHRGGRLQLPGGRRVYWTIMGAKARMRPSSWHPEFGLSVPNQCLEARLTAASCRTAFTW